MPKNLVSLPGYRVYEYLLVLRPNDELVRRIVEVKQAFARSLRAEAMTPAGVHLSLATFSSYEMTEAKIINRIGSIGAGIAPFNVELRDFGAFPSHTIYISVATRGPVQHLLRELKQAQGLLTLNKENKPHFIGEPHIPVGRKLKPWQFEQGWREYASRSFSGRFTADGMILLRRQEGESQYRPVVRFEFQNQPVMAKQGSLFG